MKKSLDSKPTLAQCDPMKRALRKAAAILGSAKTEKKAAAARINGTRPKRKKKAVEYFETDERWKIKAIPPK